MLGHARRHNVLGLTAAPSWSGRSRHCPLLAIHILHQGGSGVVVGVVMAAFFAAVVLLSVVARCAPDRLGRVEVLVAGLLACTVGAGLLLV